MEITYDTRADALYIQLKKGKFARNKEIEEGIVVDLASHGGLLGIEVLEASTRMSPADLADIRVRVPL